MKFTTRFFSHAALCAAIGSAYLFQPLTASATTLGANFLYDPVVAQIGDGTNALGAQSGTTTNQIYSANVANQIAPFSQSAFASSGIGAVATDLTNTGNSTTEAQISNNGALTDAAAAGLAYSLPGYVFNGGYGAADNTAAVIAAATNANRQVGYMTVTGGVLGAGVIGASQTQAAAYSGSNIRGATGDNTATNFWAGGTSSSTPGYRYMSAIPSVQTSTTVTNTRAVQIRNGILTGSADSGTFAGVNVIGAAPPTIGAPPTTTGNTVTSVILTTVNGGSTGTQNPNGYLLLDDPNVATPAGIPFNVAYIADAGTGNGTSSGATAGIQKWVYSPASGTWAWAYSISDNLQGATITGYWGVAGQLDNSGAAPQVILFGTTNGPLTAAGGNKLEQFIDPLEAGTAAGTDATEVTLATAGTNLVFRGVALAPISVPEPASLVLGGLGLIGLLGVRRRLA